MEAEKFSNLDKNYNSTNIKNALSNIEEAHNAQIEHFKQERESKIN